MYRLTKKLNNYYIEDESAVKLFPTLQLDNTLPISIYRCICCYRKYGSCEITDHSIHEHVIYKIVRYRNSEEAYIVCSQVETVNCVLLHDELHGCNRQQNGLPS